MEIILTITVDVGVGGGRCLQFRCGRWTMLFIVWFFNCFYNQTGMFDDVNGNSRQYESDNTIFSCRKLAHWKRTLSLVCNIQTILPPAIIWISWLVTRHTRRTTISDAQNQVYVYKREFHLSLLDLSRFVWGFSPVVSSESELRRITSSDWGALWCDVADWGALWRDVADWGALWRDAADWGPTASVFSFLASGPAGLTSLREAAGLPLAVSFRRTEQIKHYQSDQLLIRMPEGRGSWTYWEEAVFVVDTNRKLEKSPLYFG